MYDLATLKSYGCGRWGEILLSLAPHLSEFITRGRRHGPCPLCGGKDRARCHNDFDQTGRILCNQCGGGWDGIETLKWANCWSFKEAVEAIEVHLGITDGQIPKIKLIPKSEPPVEKDWEVEKQRLKKIWDETEPDSGRIAEYFQFRGLDIPVPSTLRFYPKLVYIHEGPYVQFPCMIARVTRKGETIGIFRTWLAEDEPGKADVSQPKKSWKCVDRLNGGAIKIFPAEPGKPLVLCEGIETGMAIRQMMGFPTWACTSHILLENVEVPRFVNKVIIAGDLDGGKEKGQKAVEKLAERLHGEGKQVKVALPPGPIPEGAKGVDWLNILNESREVAHA